MLRKLTIVLVFLAVADEAQAQMLPPYTDLTMWTKRFSGSAINSTAVTLTEIQAAPAVGLSLYITDITFSASVTSTATVDSYPNLKYGTGTNCATGTTTIWAAYTVAFDVGAQVQFATPIKLPPANALCWMHAVAGSKNVVVNGFIAP